MGHFSRVNSVAFEVAFHALPILNLCNTWTNHAFSKIVLLKDNYFHEKTMKYSLDTSKKQICVSADYVVDIALYLGTIMHLRFNFMVL